MEKNIFLNYTLQVDRCGRVYGFENDSLYFYIHIDVYNWWFVWHPLKIYTSIPPKYSLAIDFCLIRCRIILVVPYIILGCDRSVYDEHVPSGYPIVVQLRTAIEKFDDGRIAINVQQHPERWPGVNALHEHAFGLAVQAVVHVTARVDVEKQQAVLDRMPFTKRLRPESRFAGQIWRNKKNWNK